MIRIGQIFIVLLGMSPMGLCISFAVAVASGQYQGMAEFAILFYLYIALITMIGAILIAWNMGSKKQDDNNPVS